MLLIRPRLSQFRLIVVLVVIFGSMLLLGPHSSAQVEPDHAHIYIAGGTDTCETGSEPFQTDTGTTVTVTLCIHSAIEVGLPGEPVTWEVGGDPGTDIGPTEDSETGTGPPPGEASIDVSRTTAGTATVTGRHSSGEPHATISITWADSVKHIHLLTAVGTMGNVCHTMAQGPANSNATAASTSTRAAGSAATLIACVHTAGHAPVEGDEVFLASDNLGTSANTPASIGPVATGADGRATFTTTNALNSSNAGKSRTVATCCTTLQSNPFTVTWTKAIDHAHLFVQGQGSCEAPTNPASAGLGSVVRLTGCANGAAHDGIADSSSDPSTGGGFTTAVTWTKLAGPGSFSGPQELKTNRFGQAGTDFTSSQVGTSTVRVRITTPGPVTEETTVNITWSCPFTGSMFPFNSSAGIYVAAGNVDGDACGDAIVGSGEGELPRVRVLKGDGSLIEEFAPYAEGFRGGVRVAAGDVDGDGTDEVITASGPGSSGHVRVWKLASPATPIAGWFAYPDGFFGGAFVAAGDVTGNTNEEVVTGAGESGGSHVLVFNGAGAVLNSFFAYPDGFYGGVRVGSGDVGGADTKAEIITGAGPTGGPHARIFTGAAGDLGSIFAYPDGFYGGIYVAAGDLVPGGKQEVITGAGQSGGSHVRWFDASANPLGSLFAYPGTFFGGVRVAAGDVNGDGLGDLVTGAGPSGGAHVRIFPG